MPEERSKPRQNDDESERRGNEGNNQEGKRTPSPDLEQRETAQGRLPGTRYVRIVRPFSREFQRRAPGHLVATERVLRPTGLLGRAGELARGVLFGPRLRTEQEMQERVGTLKGLAVFASDNISSSAYATEEIMRMLVLASIGALALTMPLSIAIVVILAIVVISYRQVIYAYPNGGGSYVVAHENLGPVAGLAAGAALLTDYILTVAVSTSAGIAAITSAFPEIYSQRVPISVAVVALMTILNLRGIQESGNIFAAPTYLYVIAIIGLLGIGFYRMATGTMPDYVPPPVWLSQEGTQPLTVLLILRAFASGSVALSGTEAVSNGVPAFRPPEVKNSQTVLVLMGTLFGTLFLGISFFASRIGIVPDPTETETVLSQLTRVMIGGSSPYYFLVQFSTAVILVLAANTAFNGFPRLASVMAADGYLPNQFQYRGDRLAFSVGIIVLALVSALLIVAFSGSVTGLIPLYTIGVFVAFTLSQSGLVRHWHRLRAEERGWQWRAAVNGLGAIATGVVALVVAISKFALGAWMVLILIPLLMAMMWGIQHHYRKMREELAPGPPALPLPRIRPPYVLVPLSRLDRATLQTLAFARSISPEVTAVHVSVDPRDAAEMRQAWEQWGIDVPMVIVESPYRALIPPLMAYIDAMDKQDPGRPITVVLTEIIPEHFWDYFLHNQSALRLKLKLFFRPNTIVIDVPYRPGQTDEHVA